MRSIFALFSMTWMLLLMAVSIVNAAIPLPRENPIVSEAATAATSPADPVGLAPEATANLQKEFTLEGFFAGETIAKGTIFSKTVGAARSFAATTRGTWDGKVLTLVESYQYAAGDKEQRVWRFHKTGTGRYTAESDEILRNAKITIKGRIATFKYQKKIRRAGGKSPIKVTFSEEWAFRRNGVLASRTRLKKLVSVGQEAINFVRVGNEAVLQAPRF